MWYGNHGGKEIGMLSGSNCIIYVSLRASACLNDDGERGAADIEFDVSG